MAGTAGNGPGLGDGPSEAGADGVAYPPRRAVAAWVLFDPACQPFFTLITTFIFAPYFASAVVVDDAARGQALWGYAAGFAGLLIAVGSPVLGAVADASGRRKPWIAAFGALLVAGSLLLWFAAPGDEARIPLILAAFVLATVGAEFATAFNNAIMPDMVPPGRLGRLSGLGFAAGYVGGLVALAVMLLFFATAPQTGHTLLGLPPALGLDAATREGDRFSGPFTALWFVVLVMPMFLLVPDRPPAMPVRAAAREGIARTAALLRRLRGRPELAHFLLANMVYTDGLVALFAFGGIYGAGVFGWGSIEIGTFGILLSIAGTFGALAGGRLDDTVGARTVILASLAVLVTASLGIVSLDPDSLLFGLVPVPPGPGGLFASLPEQLFLACGIAIGTVASPLQAAARTLLARLAPRENIAEFFGLFALSGKMTSFAAPILVATVTAASGSQKTGISVLLAFFGLGAVLLLRVREPGRDPG